MKQRFLFLFLSVLGLGACHSETNTGSAIKEVFIQPKSDESVLVSIKSYKITNRKIEAEVPESCSKIRVVEKGGSCGDCLSQISLVAAKGDCGIQHSGNSFKKESLAISGVGSRIVVINPVIKE